MFRFHRSAIRLTATTLLVVFLSALLGPVAALAQVSLRRECVKAAAYLPGMPQAHHHHQEQDHDGDHQDEHRAPAPHAPKSPPHHDCTSGDDQQLSSLTPLLKLLAGHATPAVLALPPAQSFLRKPFQAWNRQLAVVLVPPERLKPKIPDLRIFLSSLII